MPFHGLSATAESPPATRARIDALVADLGDPHDFLREVRALAQALPDDTCEILSVIDQYYRRRKIPREVYQQVEQYLSVLLVRGQQNTYTRLPLPLPQPADQPTVARSITPDSSVPVVEGVIERAADLRPGDVLRDRYRLVAIVGQGAIGTVWEAIDQNLVGVPEESQRLAIKVLRRDVVEQPPLISPLLTEFVHLRSLSHPNIVRVHDFDRDGDAVFMTMELLTGAPLGRILSVRNGTALERGHAYTIIREIGAALTHAHSRGVTHGDLNPENIFLTRCGEVRVVNFDTSTVGAPEASDDLFALACLAYLLLSGKHPFTNRTAIEARAAGSSPLRPTQLTTAQWTALQEGLGLGRDRRPSNVAEWVSRLEPPAALQPLPGFSALLTVPPRRRMRQLMPALAAALILLTAGGVWMTGAAGLRFTGPEAIGAHKGVVRPRRRVLQHAVAHFSGVDHAAVHRAPAPGGVGGVHARRRVLTAASKTPLLARIELMTNMVTVAAGGSFVRIVILRRGNWRRTVSFVWRTESGTAMAGKDFLGFSARTAHIKAGRRSLSLFIPIVSDSRRLESKRFYVKIDDPGPGALLGERTIAMITIPASHPGLARRPLGHLHRPVESTSN